MIKRSNDKLRDLNNYDNRAQEILYNNKNNEILNYEKLEKYHRFPYERYYDLISHYVKRDHKVLELGAGFGLHTEIILKSVNEATITDISENCLRLIKKLYSNYRNFTVHKADIETLPFKDCSFDAVCIAGSLSYGDYRLVKKEIFRVLKKDGYLIAVDSLNNNPLYVLNRYFSYFLGNRTMNTIRNMPSIKKLKYFQKNNKLLNFDFFGSLIWLVPCLKLFMGQNKIAHFIKYSDIIFKSKYLAFKFTIVIKKR